MKPNKSQSRARTMSDPQVLLGRSVIRATSSPKKHLLEAGSHTDTQESNQFFKHSRDDMPPTFHNCRKNRSFTDNEAGSQNSTEDIRVIDIKRIVPQIKEFREKKAKKGGLIPEFVIEIDPGMEAGSQTSEIESRSPTNKFPIPILTTTTNTTTTTTTATTTTTTKGKKTKTIPTSDHYKKDAKRIQKNPVTAVAQSLTSFASSAGLAIEAGSETSPGYHHPPNEQLVKEKSLRKYFRPMSQSTKTGGHDFGTNAASGNDSVGIDNFELVYEAEIAFFQKNYDLERERENISSDTDGSKAISEGSSTAEGAASAAEGHHEFYQ